MNKSLSCLGLWFKGYFGKFLILVAVGSVAELVHYTCTYMHLCSYITLTVMYKQYAWIESDGY